MSVIVISWFTSPLLAGIAGAILFLFTRHAGAPWLPLPPPPPLPAPLLLHAAGSLQAFPPRSSTQGQLQSHIKEAHAARAPT